MTEKSDGAPWPEDWQQTCEECGTKDETVRHRIPIKGAPLLCHQCFWERR